MVGETWTVTRGGLSARVANGCVVDRARVDRLAARRADGRQAVGLTGGHDDVEEHRRVVAIGHRSTASVECVSVDWVSSMGISRLAALRPSSVSVTDVAVGVVHAFM